MSSVPPTVQTLNPTHEAFQLVPVFENAKKYKITAIESWGPRRVIVGGSDGCVRIFETNAQKQSFSKLKPNSGSSDFPLAKKAIDQLIVGHVGKSQYILIVLSDGLVQVFDLPSMRLLQSLNSYRGTYLLTSCGGIPEPVADTRLAQVPQPPAMASSFEDPPTAGHPQHQPRSFPFYLCVAHKKKHLSVVVFDPKKQQFVLSRDLVVPDQIRDMYACPGSVCIGFRREYALVDLYTGGMRDIFPVGRKGAPLVAPFSDTELVLSRDQDSIWVRWADGEPTRREAGLVWSDPPQALLFYHPYFLALLPNHLEIRNSLTKSLVQIIPLKMGRLFNRNSPAGGLFVATSNSLYLIREIPFSQQMNALVKAHLYVEAMNLVQSSHDQQWSQPEEREKALKDIHTLYAYHLFNKGDYAKSLYYFDEAGRSPRQILNLFPDVLPSSESLGTGMDADFSPGKEAFQDPQMVKELEGDESLRAIAALVPYLNRVRQRLSREAEHAKEERKKQRREAFAQRRQQREQRLQHLRREQEIARRAFRQQQPFNLDFLPGGPGVVDGATSGDPRLMELEAEIAAELQRVAEDAAEEAAAEGEEEEDEEEELERLMEPEIGPDGKQRMALRVLVDTVLLKTYLMINIHMAMQMAKEPNFCDIEESSNIICSYDRYGVLIQLLKTRGQHRRALEKLKELGQESNELHEFHGPKETIEYLTELAKGPQPCTEEEVEMILEFSPWVLAADPDKALSIFTVSLENYQRRQADEQRKRQLALAEELRNLGGPTPRNALSSSSTAVSFAEQKEDSESFTPESQRSQRSPRNVLEELEAEDEAERRAREQATKYGGLDPSLVMVHLKRHTSQSVQSEYLECLINVAGETGMKFHNELVILYLNQLKEHIKREEAKGNHSCGAGVVSEEANPEFGRLRRGLLRILSTSQYYQPEDKLSLLPRQKLLEERAVLLSRLNRHEEALTIYAHILKKPMMAMEYCDRLYDEAHPELRQIYLLLVKVHVKPDPSLDRMGMFGDVSPNIDAALSVMVSTHNRLDCAAALSLIPGDVPLLKIMPFLTLVLSSTTHSRRTKQVIRHLLEAEHMTAKFECMEAEREPIVIDRSTVCPRCHKRLGNVAFARYPNGDVVHYMCHTGTGGGGSGMGSSSLGGPGSPTGYSYHSPHDVGSFIGGLNPGFDFDPANASYSGRAPRGSSDWNVPPY